MILPAVNDYFCYKLTRSWGDISLNSCIFQTTKSQNTFFSMLNSQYFEKKSDIYMR